MFSFAVTFTHNLDPGFKLQVFYDDDVRQQAPEATRRAMVVKAAEADAPGQPVMPRPSTLLVHATKLVPARPPRWSRHRHDTV